MGSTVGPDTGKCGLDDRVLPIVTAAMQGIALTLPTSVNATPGILGPSATLIITYQQKFRHHSVVTYHWNGHCLPADGEIDLVWNGKSEIITFTFPDGTQDSALSSDLSDALLWSNATRWTDSGVPLDGYTYGVQVGPAQRSITPKAEVD